MAYVDLGKYQFDTAADYTGLNAGNLTSILQTSAIRIPYFEMYRLMINTSQVPPIAALPSLVQQTPLHGAASGTALALTFPKATTHGNLVVVAVGGVSTGNNPVSSAVTLGGSADNFSASPIATGGTATSYGPAGAIWADPSCAQASTAVAVTLGSSTGTPYVFGQAWEVSNMLATSSAAASWDFWEASGLSGGSTSLLTVPNVGTTKANDFQVGFGISDNSTTFTMSNPQGLMSQTAAPVNFSGGSWAAALASWQVTGVIGSNTAYQVALSNAGNPLGMTAGFYPSATAPVAVPFPFTVAIDGNTWDQQQTVAGVGYTYAIGQSPLYLNTGQTLQILWQLPATTYAQYSQGFNITGWFRYDPSTQPS